ncbi:MAG: hypothetical protein P1P80_08805 [ANME-2 cluster archaeon]|nr:hypothetical protein [ANME-2 cluster archaeon]
MPDIGLIWDTKLLFEKLFVEHGFDYQPIHPTSIGSPFIPKFKLVIIPTGFANPQYSNVLPSLIRNSTRIGSFIEAGGTLLVFGALMDSYTYDWLPLDLAYIQRYGPVELFQKSRSEASQLIADSKPECDGYFSSYDGDCIMVTGSDEPVLVTKEYGEGLIIATTIHEFPTPEFIRWALDGSKPASL